MKKGVIGIMVAVCLVVLLVNLSPRITKRLSNDTNRTTTQSETVDTTQQSSADITFGTEDWTYAMQAPDGGKDEIDGVAVDSEGNVFYGGPFEATVDFNGTKRTAKNGTDIHLSKLSPDGKEIWFTSIDSGGDDFMWDMEATPDGDIVISGGYGGTLTVNGRTYVAAKDGSALFAKIDGATGDIVWVTTAGVAGTGSELVDAGRTAGGNEIKVDSEGNAVAILSAHGDSYRIGGKTYTPHGVMDGFVVKLSPAGEFLWVYQFEGNAHKQGRAIAITGDDAVILGYEYFGTIEAKEGPTVSSEGKQRSGAVALISKAGVLQWLLPVSSDGFSNVRGAGGDSSGNVYITGVITGDATIANEPVVGYLEGSSYVAKLPPTGTPTWIRVLGNNEADNGGELISNDDYIAISGVNVGDNYNLYDGAGALLLPDVFTLDAKKQRATLAIFTTDGQLSGRYEPASTIASNGGVLEFVDNCVIVQLSFYGLLEYHNGDSYTAANNARKLKPDRDASLAKVCF